MEWDEMESEWEGVRWRISGQGGGCIEMSG